jgi:thiol-disulfide isomerase/thioredoxin
MTRLRIAAFLAAALACAPASAQLFKCTGADGKVGYQDAPCPPSVTQKKIPTIYGDPSGAGPGGMEMLDPDAAAKRIAAQQAAATVVVLYSSKCGLCQQVMPQLSELARRYQGRGVEWLAFSTDAPEDLASVAPFLAESRAPFALVALRPWAPGQLTRAFAPLGIAIDAQPWTRPFIAVRDRNGKVAFQSDGVADVSQLAGAVDALAGRAEAGR